MLVGMPAGSPHAPIGFALVPGQVQSLYTPRQSSPSPSSPFYTRYTTFCGLAGVDPTDERAAAAGLPPVDGHDLWPLISGANATSPRTEVR